MGEAYKNAIAGGGLAITNLLFGHPFDVIKTRAQASKNIPLKTDILNLWKNEGVLGFYRGLSMPALSKITKRPITYALREKIKVSIPKSVSPIINNIFTGAITSIFLTFISTPMNVLKVGAQASKKRVGVLNMSLHYWNNEGGFFRLYKGFFPNMIKDCLMGATFTGVYFSLRDYHGQDASYYLHFINGVLADWSCWILYIPVDHFKTRIQNEKNTNFKQVIRTTPSLKTYYRGLLPIILRGVLISGVGMTTYEYIRNKLLLN